MTRRSLPAAGIATLAYVVSQAHIGGLLYQLRPNIFVLQLSFRSDRYWAVLGQWGEAGMRSYRAHLPWDFAHLFIYAAFGYVLATRVGLFDDANSATARRAAWMLPLAAVFDLAENLFQVHLLGGPFGVESLAVPLSACCSAIKWGLAAGFALIVVWRLVRKSAAIGLLSQ